MIDITKIRLHDELVTPDGYQGRVQGLIREKGERTAVLLSFVLDRPHPPEFDIKLSPQNPDEKPQRPLWYLVSYPPEMLSYNGKNGRA